MSAQSWRLERLSIGSASWEFQCLGMSILRFNLDEANYSNGY